nr:SpoIIE family protein phosphatase [Galbitalea soli]
MAAEFRATNELDQERQRASEVQRSLLPKQALQVTGYDIAGGCSPARTVGGDFFDWYQQGDGVIFTLADVMGKGTGAAIIASAVRAVLRSESSENLAASVEAVAESLADDLEQAGSFFTLFHARLDPASGEVRYVDAGHGLTVVVRANGGMDRLATGSFPIGMGLELGWREHRVRLAPGDTLVSVSDGVLELFDGTLESLDHLEGIIRDSATAQGIVDELEVLRGELPVDDVTAVVVRAAWTSA